MQKICKALSEGGTMMLDLTWSSNDLITDLSLEIGIPYVKVDVSISPFLILLDKYLDLRNSTDVTLIFDDNQSSEAAASYGPLEDLAPVGLDLAPDLYNCHSMRRSSATILANAGGDITTLKRHGTGIKELIYGSIRPAHPDAGLCSPEPQTSTIDSNKKKNNEQLKANRCIKLRSLYQIHIDQSLYYWIDTTRLRMLISEKLDRATARRLKHIRPIPNSFAIIATTTKMDTLFKVAVQEDLITRPDRWNLLFLDFVHESFDKKLIFNKPISSLKLDASICCNFLAAEELCQCPENFNLPKEFLYLATSIILKVIQVLVKDGLELTNNLQCNGTTYNEQSKKELDNYNFIYRENSVLRIKVSGNVEVGSNSSTEIVAKCRDNVMTVVDGKTVTTVRPFYRIGITRAIPWSYKEKDPATGQWRWTGYCADFAQKISEQMDFDYEFVEPKSGTFGKRLTASGMESLGI
ncbi:hypothetical protein NQ317_006418 [Molorchus minor]|uniref:Ionotropic glutamate receptor L-glutamate and glycine-binding domain-containing protein n=1 Tax=Molorchus minor TaxID=1323400 RepID=A0ABQ9JZT3_9CUCU|nr:hypothetical protein NQ317_006418 [Molorchus minor]